MRSSLDKLIFIRSIAVPVATNGNVFIVYVEEVVAMPLIVELDISRVVHVVRHKEHNRIEPALAGLGVC